MKNLAYLTAFVIGLLLLACSGRQSLPVDRYYDYDRNFPLEDSVRVEVETDQSTMYSVSYRSVHESIVAGLLTIPKKSKQPLPVIIFLHGIGDHKQKDYMEAGHKFMVDSGYAVLRIDIANHGDRKIHKYKYDMVTGYRYWTRDIVAQTVFDLRRGIDFLETRPEIDSSRIGFYGISLGGIIGTVFCAVDERVKVPVITLAGGGLHLAFKFKAFAEETQVYLSIIDPINFVDKIAPRPLLMLNADKDEVVPPITSKMMYNKAGEPKHIVWYPTKHRRIPIDQAFPEGIRWFNKYL
ncbi:acetylxylan esterase [candidate division KSB1 bacterium]|nr:acetylxylan esterase [candidate division KSB1 bacterium]